MRDDLVEGGFCEQNRFVSGPADWFVIGGRWSGKLTELELSNEKYDEYWERLNKVYESIPGTKPKTDEERKMEITKIYKDVFPHIKVIPPKLRDTYRTLGYEDDAKIIDDNIFDKIIQPAIDAGMDFGWPNYHDGGAILDLERNEHYTRDNLVGRYWIVVIDFHI